MVKSGAIFSSSKQNWYHGVSITEPRKPKGQFVAVMTRGWVGPWNDTAGLRTGRLCSGVLCWISALALSQGLNISQGFEHIMDVLGPTH